MPPSQSLFSVCVCIYTSHRAKCTYFRRISRNAPRIFSYLQHYAPRIFDIPRNTPRIYNISQNTPCRHHLYLSMFLLAPPYVKWASSISLCFAQLRPMSNGHGCYALSLWLFLNEAENQRRTKPPRMPGFKATRRDVEAIKKIRERELHCLEALAGALYTPSHGSNPHQKPLTSQFFLRGLGGNEIRLSAKSLLFYQVYHVLYTTRTLLA